MQASAVQAVWRPRGEGLGVDTAAVRVWIRTIFDFENVFNYTQYNDASGVEPKRAVALTPCGRGQGELAA